MRDPLSTRILTLRRRLRRRAIVAGALSIVAIVFGVALAVGLLDYVVRFEDSGIRFIASIALLVALCAATIRYWVIPFRKRASDVGIARRIERCETQLGDLLSNAVAFLEETDEPSHGSSPVLRRAVVARATAVSEDLDWRSFVPRRPLRRAMTYAAIPVAILAGFLITSPSMVRTGALRIVCPFGDDHWPRDHHLAVRNAPQRVAKGATIKIEVVDQSGRCPDDVWLYSRSLVGNDSDAVQSRMIVADGDAYIRLYDITESFEFRVTGGDDQTMAWRAVEVIDSPRVVEKCVTLYPPEYTGFPPRPSADNIRTLIGARISVDGRASLPIRRARVVLDDGETIEATVSDDQHSFTIAETDWLATKTTQYRYELDSDDSVEVDVTFDQDSERYALRVEPDPAPSVSIEAPTNDVYATSDAVLAVNILAKDNLAIQSITLVYAISDRSEDGEQRLVIWSDEDRAPIVVGTDASRVNEHRRVVEYAWDIASLNLTAGTEIVLSAEATDYRPGVGQATTPKRIHVVASHEMESLLAERHTAILADLYEALQLEQDARREVQSFLVQIEEVGDLTASDIDDFQAIEATQRRVEHILTDEVDGTPQRIQGLIKELKSNHVESIFLSERIADISKVLDRISKTELPKIRRGLLTLGKSSAMTDPENEGEQPGMSVKTAIADVASGQDGVIRGIEELVGDMEQWAGYRQFARDIGQLLADQRELLESVEREFGSDEFASHPNPAHHDIVRNESAARQRELARRLGVTVSKMRDTIDALDQREPAIAESLFDSLEAIERHGIRGAMRDASRDMEENRIQRAVDRQTEIALGLDEALRALRDRDENALEDLPTKLREAEAALTTMRKKLRDLQSDASRFDANETNDDTDALNQLRKLQKSTAGITLEIERMARRLERLTAGRASRSAEQAARRLAAQQDASLAEPTASETGQENEAPLADALDNARRDLENAQLQLAERLREVERELAEVQHVEVAASIETLRDNQLRLLGETIRIEAIATSAEGLHESDEQSADRLTDGQRDLRTETAALAASSNTMRVLRVALESAGETMQLAAERLLQRDFGDATQSAERLAIDRLESILDALVEPTPAPENDVNGGSPGGRGLGSGDEQEKPTSILALAEIKLLRSMQQEIFEKTALLETANEGKQKWAEEDRRAFEAVAGEQAKLAAIVFSFIERDASDAIGGDSETESEDASKKPSAIDEAHEEELGDEMELPPLDVMPDFPPVSLIDVETQVRTRFVENASDSQPSAQHTLNPSAQGERARPRARTVEMEAEWRDTLNESTSENGGAASESAALQDPILRIGERMQEASHALNTGDPTGAASELQGKILADLDRLIEIARSQNRNNPSAGSKSEIAKQRRNPKGARSESDSTQEQRASTQSNGEPTDTLNPGAAAPTERRDMQGLLKNLWGRLPDRAREQMIESPPEEFLPEYELEIEQYYRRLAEESAAEAP